MTQPSPAMVRAAQVAGARMADRNTSFIFNEWYVGAFADEVGRSLLRRTLLGRDVIFYRTQDGRAVALDNRCIHRSFPLSEGLLDGDTVICGYHGFRYAPDGELIQVPSQDRCPKGLGVRNYPVIERGPLLWIWLGDEAADPALLPPHDWLVDPDWVCSKGYFHLRGNYVSLHENLLDLTHLSYLHAKSFGTPDYAAAKFDAEISEGRVALLRDVVPTTLPPVWAKPTGMEGYPQAARIVRSEFLAPSLHTVAVRFYDNALPEAGRPEFRIRTAHIPTPETHGTTHYFIVHGRDFAQDQDWVTQHMHDGLFTAFQEDVDGMQHLERMLEKAGEDFYEVSVASDRASVEMRKYIKARADAEAQALATTQEQPVAPPVSLAGVA
ncbi:MAG: Rieske 2Fe-2S domain-containing protein [Pigmentiphaga sp.]